MQPIKPVQPQPIYIDTSAFYALIDRSDRHHEAAKALWPSLLDSHITLLTSSYVVCEAMSLLQYRLGFAAASLWHKAVLEVVDVQWVDSATHRLGHELWMSLGRQGCSLVDCVSYITMNRHQVEKAFCFKAAYTDQGFTLLPGQCSQSQHTSFNDLVKAEPVG